MSKSNYVWFNNHTMVADADLPDFLGTTPEHVKALIDSGVFERIGYGRFLHWHQGYPDIFDRDRVRSDFDHLRYGGMVVFLDGADDDDRA